MEHSTPVINGNPAWTQHSVHGCFRFKILNRHLLHSTYKCPWSNAQLVRALKATSKGNPFTLVSERPRSLDHGRRRSRSRPTTGSNHANYGANRNTDSAAGDPSPSPPSRKPTTTHRRFQPTCANDYPDSSADDFAVPSQAGEAIILLWQTPRH